MSFIFDFDALTSALLSKQGMVQLALLLVAFLMALLAARIIRLRLPDDLEPGLAKIGAGSAHRLVLPLSFLVFALLSRALLAKLQPVPIFHVAMPLIASYAMIRLALYVLRHLIPPSPFLKTSERFIAITVWGIVALYLTGVLPELLGALEDTRLVLNKQELSLRQILEALVLALITLFIALSISSLIEKRVMRAATIDMSSRVVITKFVRALSLVVALLIALPLVGIPLSLLSVFGGALGVGLGFGMQKIASNYVSGFIILLDRSIRLGDLITIEGRHGVVQGIKGRYTVIKGLDGTEAIIPNDSLVTNTVINHTYTDPKVAVKISVTVAYETDLDIAMAILLASARDNPRVEKNPAPVVQLKELGDNGIELELTVWIHDAELGQSSLRSDVLMRAWRAFREAKISIPYPQRELRFVNAGVVSDVPNGPLKPSQSTKST